MAISYLPKSSPCRPGFHDSVIENIFPIYIFKAVNQQKQEGCENNTWITLQRGESSFVDVSYSLSSSLSPPRESCKTWTSWMVLFLFPGLSGREREREWSQCACSKLPAPGQGTEGWAAYTMSGVEATTSTCGYAPAITTVDPFIHNVIHLGATFWPGRVQRQRYFFVFFSGQLVRLSLHSTLR